jgi:hypothetical protein
MLQVPNGYVLLPIPQTQLEYSMTENKNYAAAGLLAAVAAGVICAR